MGYFVSRIYNLLSLPIFNDEAFFIWAGRQIAADPVKNFFFNFTDGKEPLFFWVYAWPAGFFPDALLGIRLTTVFFGLLSLVYFAGISQRLKINPLLTGLAFVLNPFLLFYDRIGMQETLLTFLLLAGIYYLLAKRQILTGLFLGLALLTKTSSVALIIFLLPVLFSRRYFKSFLIMVIVYLPVLFGLSRVSAHNSSYVGIIPLSQILANFKQTVSWTQGYLGWPLAIAGFPALLPALAESLVARIYFPRYFLFCVPLVILFAARLLRKYPWVFLLLLIPNILLSWTIVTDVQTAPLPYIERWQYLESWPAGYGIAQTARFLKERDAKRIIVEDIMLTKYGLPYYYPSAGYSVGGEGDYYVFDREQYNFPLGLKLVAAFPKVGDHERISVFRSND